MAKQDNSRDKNKKSDQLDQNSADNIKAAGTGVDKQKEGRDFKKKSKFKGSKNGNHLRNKSNDPS